MMNHQEGHEHGSDLNSIEKVGSAVCGYFASLLRVKKLFRIIPKQIIETAP
jgi:hypothetical protein